MRTTEQILKAERAKMIAAKAAQALKDFRFFHKLGLMDRIIDGSATAEDRWLYQRDYQPEAWNERTRLNRLEVLNKVPPAAQYGCSIFD